MELYLIRHGIAVESNGVNDEERELTAEGQQKTHKVAKRLRQLGQQFDLILTSPLVRSRQTAQILQDNKLSSQIEASTPLAPDGCIHTWLGWLEQWRQHRDASTLALVGHQPNLGHWAEILVWGQVQNAIVLKKAGIIGLILPEANSPIGTSQLFWLTAPKLLV